MWELGLKPGFFGDQPVLLNIEPSPWPRSQNFLGANNVINWKLVISLIFHLSDVVSHCAALAGLELSKIACLALLVLGA